MVLLITGGAGFIGANLARYWLERRSDDDVIALDKLAYGTHPINLASLGDHPRLKFIQADLADFKAVRRIFEACPIGGIFHAAAQSHVDKSIADPAGTVQDNILGTFHLLEAARLFGGRDLRFHYVSTDEVFGQLGPEGVFSESSAYAPDNPYSATKAAGDHLVGAYCHTYGLKATITHCANNYGPYQFPDKFIPRMIRRAIAGEPLPVYGTGENVRDWLHVRDHCRALSAVFDHAQPGETYCVGGGNEWRNLDLARLLCRLVDAKLDRPAGSSERRIAFVKDRPGHDFRYALDASKIRRDLGWSPSVSLEQGLSETIDWYLSRPDWVESVLSSASDFLR